MSLEFNGLSTSNGVYDMLKGRDGQSTDTVFSFPITYVENASRLVEDSKLAKRNTMHKDLFL